MSESTTQAPQTNGASNPADQHAKDQDRDRKQAEQDMLYRLKNAIDSKGRYAYRLDDMASGYAAAQGTDSLIARNEIEQKFETSFGRSPKDYLDQHYDRLRANGTNRKQGNGRGR